MELMACVLALRECNRLKLASGKSRIVIRTDSLYIVENYKRAMFEWSKNRWFKSYTAHDYLESLFFMNSGFLFIISKRDIKQ
jgi:ribonuclease HI